jgi:hypothetical protein
MGFAVLQDEIAQRAGIKVLNRTREEGSGRCLRDLRA